VTSSGASSRPAEGRFYGDLASWWPLISPVEDYAEEGGVIRDLLADHELPVQEVLELGSGGGHLAANLGAELELTLTDLSLDMLEQSRRLNPACVHVRGDMRELRLGRRFDAVLIHDAIGYMISEDELRAALVTAWEHLGPGGLAVVLPDATREIFTPGEDVSGCDAPDRSVRLFEWTFDPDTTDGWVQTEYVFVLRDDAGVRVVHETHRFGLFERSTWLRLFAEVGFDARRIVEPTTEDRVPRDVFLAVRPRSGPLSERPNRP
jgi:SAM-dependent methyltransferase